MRHSHCIYKPQRRQGGFTILELVIVMIVMLVVTVAALPSIFGALQALQLRNSAQDVAGLLQTARIQSVKDNRFYSVIFANSTTAGQIACIDLNWNNQCDAGEPTIQLGSGMSLLTDGSGTPYAVIACGSLSNTACPSGFTGLNYNPQAATVSPSYNSRGLPCVGSPASPPPNWSSGGQCVQFDPNNSNRYPVGFLYELQYASSNGNAYAAISVTPTGLVGVWLNNNGTWAQE